MPLVSATDFKRKLPKSLSNAPEINKAATVKSQSSR
jgi:hypothetical protein